MTNQRVLGLSAGLPFPALVVHRLDARILEDPSEAGFEHWSSLEKGVEIPHVPFALDLRNDPRIEIQQVTSETDGVAICAYEFPRRRPEWSEQVHESRQALLVLTDQDPSHYATINDALGESHLGRVVLVLGGFHDGVGTRPSP